MWRAPYYKKLKVSGKTAVAEIIIGAGFSTIWFFVRNEINTESLLYQIEPMVAGLLGALAVHLIGMRRNTDDADKTD